MPLAALEALLDTASDAAVRNLWEALDAVGLPSQAHHRGATNAPHLTVVAAPRIDEAVAAAARALLGPLLPCPVEVCGHVAFGVPPRVTLALLCTVPEPLRAAVVGLEALGGPPARGWVPHITLARRMTAEQVGQALEVVGRHEPPVSRLALTRVRHWDPVTRSAAPVVGG